MLKNVFLLLVLAGSTLAAQTTRIVDLSWSASTSATLTGFQGYNVFRQVGAATPVQLNTTPVAALSYVDATAVIGQTYTYTVTAVAVACTPTTPTTSVCGSSPPSTGVTTTIPVPPAVSTSTTIVIP